MFIDAFACYITRRTGSSTARWQSGSVIRIVTVYRPPSTDRKSVPFQSFLDEFSIVLERCATHQTTCVILGDFNVHYGDNRTCNTWNFTELLQEADFRQHVREPTHIGDHTLDLFITRNSQNTLSSISVETLLTDHHVFRCDKSRSQIKYRKYASIDNTKLVSDFENSNLFNNLNYGVDELYTQYNSTIAGFIDSHAPLITRVIIIRPKTPWYN